MFSIVFMLCLILVEKCSIQAYPITLDLGHYTRSNFTPVITERIRKKLMAQTNPVKPVQMIGGHQQMSRKRLRKPPPVDAGVSNVDNIKFMDFENDDTLEEGAPCKRSHDGLQGYCLPTANCRQVLNEFKMFRTKIDICGYSGSKTIVCCPFERRKEPNDKAHAAKRISARYCHQYSKLGLTRDSFVRRTANPVLVEEKAEPTCSFPVPLIVGGKSTKLGEFPHMAAIGWTKSDNTIKWSCGGSLISEKFILTAAHCGQMAGKPPNVIRLGSQNLYTPTTSGRHQYHDFQIRNIIKHPNYDSNSYYNDIALIQLKGSVEFNQFMRPACLWQSSQLNVTKATATGWGRVGFRGRKAKDLQKVELNLIDRRICNDSFELQKELQSGIVNSQICAGHLEGGKDTCQGDSGGPLQVTMGNNRCIYHIIGITSFGKLCGSPNMPGVYTNVYSYLDWIEMHAFDVR